MGNTYGVQKAGLQGIHVYDGQADTVALILGMDLKMVWHPWGDGIWGGNSIRGFFDFGDWMLRFIVHRVAEILDADKYGEGFEEVVTNSARYQTFGEWFHRLDCAGVERDVFLKSLKDRMDSGRMDDMPEALLADLNTAFKEK